MFSTYKFIVGRRDPQNLLKNEIFYLVDDPAQAYVLYYKYKASEKPSPAEKLWEWYLCDSFNKNMLEFCEEQYSNALNSNTLI